MQDSGIGLNYLREREREREKEKERKGGGKEGREGGRERSLFAYHCGVRLCLICVSS